MGNLCSIFHAHFGKLVDYTRSHNKAVFLDKCIFYPNTRLMGRFGLPGPYSTNSFIAPP
ncbi:hypothetical protein ACQUW5_15090 [Legionella sp. CNM-1927-20]|uniref:hypothetical protein n=1 Tax=Legionella sp. CNM-1927-20 TaxID=3422221 RepID=UPI00403AB2A3